VTALAVVLNTRHGLFPKVLSAPSSACFVDGTRPVSAAPFSADDLCPPTPPVGRVLRCALRSGDALRSELYLGAKRWLKASFCQTHRLPALNQLRVVGLKSAFCPTAGKRGHEPLIPHHGRVALNGPEA
jgi:hypothetical protein